MVSLSSCKNLVNLNGPHITRFKTPVYNVLSHPRHNREYQVLDVLATSRGDASLLLQSLTANVISKLD